MRMVQRDEPITVADYYRLAADGVIGEDDRVELIEGTIVPMNPIGPWHASVVNQLAGIFAPHGDALGFMVSVQNPLHLSEYSELQPDLLLLRARDDHYRAAHPTPADVLLAIEVANTSERYDRFVKLPLYAREGVGEVWLVVADPPRFSVAHSPSPEGYRVVDSIGTSGSIRPQRLGDLEVRVGELF